MATWRRFPGARSGPDETSGRRRAPCMSRAPRTTPLASRRSGSPVACVPRGRPSRPHGTRGARWRRTPAPWPRRAVPRPDRARKSCCSAEKGEGAPRLERRPSAGPGARLLELRGKPQERRLVTESPGELDTDRHVLLIPEEGYGHRGLACRIEDRGERDELHRPEEPLQGIVGCRVEAPEWGRRLGERRREPDVVLDEELRDLTRDALEVLDRQQIVGGAPAGAHFVEAPGEWLEAFGTRRLFRTARPVVDAPRSPRRPHREERLADRVALEGGRRLGHVVTELRAERRGLLNRAHAIGVYGHTGRGAGRERHAQKSWRPVDLFAVRARRRWRGVGIAEIRSSRGVQKRRAVANRARHRVLDGETTEDVAVVRAERVAPARGLEAEEPAARSRNADRASAVVRVGHGDHARGHGGGRPAARAARRSAEVPGIARRPEEPGLGRRENAELGRVGFADDDESCPPQATRQLTVCVRRVATVDEGRAL